jgi:hypothetical protein
MQGIYLVVSRHTVGFRGRGQGYWGQWSVVGNWAVSKWPHWRLAVGAISDSSWDGGQGKGHGGTRLGVASGMGHWLTLVPIVVAVVVDAVVGSGAGQKRPKL